MNQLLAQAFKEVQKLSNDLQEKIAYQLLEDIQNELAWLKTLENPDIDLDNLKKMAQVALLEDQEGKTEAKGFGED